MAQRLSWLNSAIEDVESIAAFIAQDSPVYASAVVDQILASALELTDFPRMGRKVPEWEDDSIRERIVHSYRLIYRIRDTEIVVLAVIHGARLLRDGIRERQE